MQGNQKQNLSQTSQRAQTSSVGFKQLQGTQKQLIQYQKDYEKQKLELANYQAELKHRNDLIKRLQQELNQMREGYETSVQKVGEIDEVLRKTKQRTIDQEQEKYRKQIENITAENKRLSQLVNQLRIEEQVQREKDAELNELKERLNNIGEEKNVTHIFKELNVLRDEKIKRELNYKQLLKDYTDLSNQVNDIISENRVLREIYGVPDNYGFNIAEIKLAEKQKIEQYKDMVRKMQNEIEDLEKERTQLKYQLRTSFINITKSGIQWEGLSAEQFELVDQYARNLISGRQEIPETDKSREYRREIEKLQAQIQILENRIFQNIDVQLQNMVKPTQNAEDILQAVRQEHEKLKQELAGSLRPQASNRSFVDNQDHPLSFPPVALKNFEGSYEEGYSYRFQTRLKISKLLEGDDKYIRVSLQLQLMELLELLNRKEEEHVIVTNEMDDFRSRLKDLILLQDELFKTYYLEKTAMDEKVNETQNLYNAACLELNECKETIQTLQIIADQIEQKSSEQLKSQLATLLKEKAILQVNEIRMMRKYDCLQSDYNIVRAQYLELESEQAEKDIQVKKRITQLREWRNKASLIMKLLLKRLMNSVAKEDHQLIVSQCQSLREQQANLMETEYNLRSKITQLEQLEEQHLEMIKEKKLADEDNIDAEAECRMLRKKLSSLDKTFCQEMQILQKVVDYLQNSFQSAEQAFTLIDKSGIGKINLGQFRQALESMQVPVNRLECEQLMQYFDMDGDLQTLSYKEFIWRLRRLGVRDDSQNLSAVQAIVQGIKSSGIPPETVFKIIDIDNDNHISATELKSCLQRMTIKFTDKQFDALMRYIDKDQNDQIEYSEFIKLLNIGQIQEHQLAPTEIQEIKEYTPREPTFAKDWKIELLVRIEEAAQSNDIDLEQAFEAVDLNSDGVVSFTEFTSAFKQMVPELNSEQLRELWQMINTDHDNNINYKEFVDQFRKSKIEYEKKKVLYQAKVDVNEAQKKQEIKAASKTQETYKPQQQQQHQSTSYQGIRDPSNTFEIPARSDQQSFTGPVESSQEMYQNFSFPQELTQQYQQQYIRKLAAIERKADTLEAKEKSAQARIQLLESKVFQYQNFISEQEKKYKEKEQSELRYQESYMKSKEREKILENLNSGSITKQEAHDLQNQNELLQLELVETREALQVYKSIVQASADQVRDLKFIAEKKKDEMIQYQNVIRELQSQSNEAAILGKTFNQLIFARWNEANIRKKTDYLLSETKSLRNEIFEVQQQLNIESEDKLKIQTVLVDTTRQLEKQIQDLKLKYLHGITVERAEELSNKLRDLHNQKSNLQDKNRELRDSIRELQGKIDEGNAAKEAMEDLKQRLKASTSEDLSDQIYEMGENLYQIKLSELQNKREMNQAKEKQDYLEKLHAQDTELIQKLEYELASRERLIVQKEAEWRRRDEERQKFLFAPKDNLQTKTEKYLQQQNNLLDDIKILKVQNQQLQDQLDIKAKQINDLTKIREEIDNERKPQQFEKLAQPIQSLQQMRSPQGYPISQNMLEFYQMEAAEEQRVMAENAEKIIKNLQEIVDYKENQLQKKEEQIKQIKEDALKQRQYDGEEIARLKSQVGQQNQDGFQSVRHTLMQSTRSHLDQVIRAEDFETILQQEKRIWQQQHQKEIEKIELEKKQQEEKVIELQERLNEIKDRYEQEIQQKSQVSQQNELKRVRQQLKAKEKELEKLKESLKDIQQQLINQFNEQSKPTSKDKVQTNQKEIEGYAQQMKEAENLIKSQKQRLDQQQAEIKKLKAAILEQKATETDLKEEIQKLKNELQYETQKKGPREEGKRSEAPVKSEINEASKQKIAKLEEEKKQMQDQLNNYKNQEFIRKALENPANEAKIKQFGKLVKQKFIQMQNLLRDKDIRGEGKLSQANFLKAIEEIQTGMTQKEIELIFQAVQINNAIEISSFINLIQEVLKQQTQQDTFKQMQQKSPNESLLKAPKQTQNERSKIEELQQENKDLKQKLTKAEKQLKFEKDQREHPFREQQKEQKEKLKQDTKLNISEKREQSLRQSRSKSPRKTGSEKDVITVQIIETEEQVKIKLEIMNLQEIETYRSQIYESSVRIQKLEKEIQQLLSDLKRKEQEIEIGKGELFYKNEKIQELQKENAKKTEDLQKKLDFDPFTKDLILEKDEKIEQLYKDLYQQKDKVNRLEELLYRSDKENMQLRFDKEHSLIYISQMQRRLRDLDLFKYQNDKIVKELQSQYAQQIEKEVNEQLKRLNVKTSARSSSPRQKQPQKTSKEMIEDRKQKQKQLFTEKKDTYFEEMKKKKELESSARGQKELEDMIDSLKRVIDKQSREIDRLKLGETKGGKIKQSEKESELQAEIEEMKKEMHELRSKEQMNKQFQEKLQKVSLANQKLRQDLKQEIDIVEQLETKYNEVIRQNDKLLKENATLRKALGDKF